MAMESLATLLEAIIEDSARRDCHSSMAQQDGETEEILLDVELDRARYLLIRLPKSEERAQLSPREQEIVRMVAGGLPNKTIASVLNISSWTVCTYLRRIFVKLGVNSRAAMVARMELGWMQKRGLMELSSQSNASETMSLDPNLDGSNRPGRPPTRVSPSRSLPNPQRPQKNTGTPLK
jgi:two-component system, NarL family, nitrate/nitrite response regulator NarL